mmetsp:Transcript_33259/g.53293  ORF Transcript_33259/g.53293 Transcript_33259/m.53293 type:complete len:220 (+) Transcript_33259:47-706(+)
MIPRHSALIITIKYLSIPTMPKRRIIKHCLIHCKSYDNPSNVVRIIHTQMMRAVQWHLQSAQQRRHSLHLIRFKLWIDAQRKVLDIHPAIEIKRHRHIANIALFHNLRLHVPISTNRHQKRLPCSYRRSSVLVRLIIIINCGHFLCSIRIQHHTMFHQPFVQSLQRQRPCNRSRFRIDMLSIVCFVFGNEPRSIPLRRSYPRMKPSYFAHVAQINEDAG